jgi:predicted phosphoribosyltransferase
MTRKYSPLINNQAQQALNTLIDRTSSVEKYQDAMFNLGQELGTHIVRKIGTPESKVYLACTAEDADFLAKEILESLEQQSFNVGLACFWNQRINPFSFPDLQVAPIIKKYKEPTERQVDYLIVVKSIISGACVVKTNLKNLIQDIDPKSILITAPVIHEGSIQKLRNEFEPSIYEKFDFSYFAEDSERNSDGEVIPGIGGMVYNRLGFAGQDEKNSYLPKIVADRLEGHILSA